MGFILNNKGSFYEAYPFAKKAIELEPNVWESHHNLIKILINMELAINDGIKFYISENGVILTEGDENGLLLPKYFLDIVNIV